MHAFPNSKHRFGEGEEEPTRVDQEMAIGKILEKAGAKDIRFAKISREDDVRGGDKTRYNFTIDDQAAAIALFNEISFTKNLVLDGRISLKVFYVKQGK